MPKWGFLKELGIPRREFVIVFILLFNVFTWYYMMLMMIGSVVNDPSAVLVLRAVFYATAVFSALIGSIASDKIKRLRFLYFWMALGVATSLLPAFTENASLTQTSVMVLLFGVSFGLGMPSCLAYFADSTLVENRGRVSGIVLLAANVSVLPLVILLGTSSLTINSVILAIWRTWGLLLFALLKPQEKISAPRRLTSFATIFQNRSFVLYFIPWFIFCLIDVFEKSLLRGFVEVEFHRLILTIEPLLASLAALVGGIFCDTIGRKKVVIYGFVSLGIAYAVIGIAPNFRGSWYLYLLIDGVAAGILWVLFILIVWGDLAQQNPSEKYYMVGNIPFLITDVLFLLLTALSGAVPAYAAFSLASFFLFLAVLPLMYAPETLPEKKIELRRLRGYIEQAKKVREKYLGKNETED